MEDPQDHGSRRELDCYAKVRQGKNHVDSHRMLAKSCFFLNDLLMELVNPPLTHCYCSTWMDGGDGPQKNGFPRSSAWDVLFHLCSFKMSFFLGATFLNLFLFRTLPTVCQRREFSFHQSSSTIPVEFPQIHWHLSMESHTIQDVSMFIIPMETIPIPWKQYPYHGSMFLNYPIESRRLTRCEKMWNLLCWSRGKIRGNGPVEWAVGPKIGSWKMLKTKICSSKLWFLSRKGFNSSGRKTGIWPRKCSISTRNTDETLHCWSQGRWQVEINAA